MNIGLDLHLGAILLAGVAVFAMGVLPSRFEKRPLSLPIVYVVIGVLAALAVRDSLVLRPVEDPSHAALVEYFTELVVIISLAGVGLRLERRPGEHSWAPIWRLLTVGMAAMVLVTAAIGHWLLDLDWPAALLLGAVLAPTDPVLADSVQVSEPGEDLVSDVRFGLTAEAGLNDSLAFPVTYLAIALAVDGSGAATWAGWFGLSVVWRLAIGLAVGWLAGRVLASIAARLHPSSTFANAGLFVLGATLLTYGAAEVLDGYGFLAVFVAAMSRHEEVERERLIEFADDLESMLLAVGLLGLGALLAGGALSGVRWSDLGIAAALVLLVRPVTAWLSLVGAGLEPADHAAIAFFGIRGMGSLYYLSYAQNQDMFDAAAIGRLWTVVLVTVAFSVVIHGITAGPAVARLDARSDASPDVPRAA